MTATLEITTVPEISYAIEPENGHEEQAASAEDLPSYLGTHSTESIIHFKGKIVIASLGVFNNSVQKRALGKYYLLNVTSQCERENVFDPKTSFDRSRRMTVLVPRDRGFALMRISRKLPRVTRSRRDDLTSSLFTTARNNRRPSNRTLLTR